jgi:hypothetical protein
VYAFSGVREKAYVRNAQGIEAEQKTLGFFVGADSPVSGVLKKRRKCAQKGNMGTFFVELTFNTF